MGQDPRRARTDEDEDFNPLRRAADRGRSRMAIAFNPPDAQKESKTDADYHPASSTARCGKCAWGQFAPGENRGTCQIVAGEIREQDTCNHYSLDRRNERQHGKEVAAEMQEEDNKNSSLAVPDKPKKGKAKFKKAKLAKNPADEIVREKVHYQDR